jgi:hypothetical protein
MKLGQPIVLRSTEPGAYVVLDETRAYWFDGVPTQVAAQTLNELREHSASYRAVAYSDLSELRVAVVRAGGRTLLARDSSGKTWSIPIRPDDVAAAQHALDLLDIRLGNHKREDWPTKARVAATLLALALVGALDFGWTWLTVVLTLVKPSPGAVAAMGSMAIGRLLIAAIAGTLDTSAVGDGWPAIWLSVTAIFAVSLWCGRIAWRWTRGQSRPIKRPFAIVALATITVALFGTLAVTTQAVRQVGGSPFMRSLEPLAAVGLLLLGVGAALLTYKDSFRRRSGVAMLVVALALAGVGADGLPLLAGRSEITWTAGQADVAGTVKLSTSGYRLHLAPSGRRFAVQSAGRQAARYDDEDEVLSNLWRFTLASLDGTRRTTDAFDLAFVDDERVLILRPTATSGDSLDLSIEQADAADTSATWRLRIPAYYAPSLTLDRPSGIWRVTGHDVDAGSVVTTVGRIGSDSVSATRLSRDLVGGRPLHTYRDGSALIGTMHGSFGTVQMALTMFGLYPFRWDVWHVATSQRRKVATLPGLPDCGMANERDQTLLCVVRGRSGLTLWRFRSPDVVESLGALPKDAERWDIGANGRVVSTTREGTVLAIVDAATGRGSRVTVGGGVQQQGTAAESFSYATDVATASGVVATLVIRDQKSEVTFYRVK